MDLSKLAARKIESGAVLEVRHPIEGHVIEGMTITLRSIQSSQHQARIRSRIAEAAKANLDQNLTVEERYQKANTEQIEDLVALTCGWEGFEYEGEPLEFTPEKARELYSDQEYIWLRAQVWSFVNSQSNFF